MDYIRYATQGATRNLPLSPNLAQSMSFLGDMGVTMEVFSGGQPEKGSGQPRVGSVRHDHGNAADVFFYKDGRRLDWSNPDDQPVFMEIVRRAKSSGLTGFGAGDGYMQPGSMHIGYGTPAVWGAGGKGANAPDWLREAYGTVEASSQPVSMGSTSDPEYQTAQSPYGELTFGTPSNALATITPEQFDKMNKLAAFSQLMEEQRGNQLDVNDFLLPTNQF